MSSCFAHSRIADKLAVSGVVRQGASHVVHQAGVPAGAAWGPSLGGCHVRRASYLQHISNLCNSIHSFLHQLPWGLPGASVNRGFSAGKSKTASATANHMHAPSTKVLFLVRCC